MPEYVCNGGDAALVMNICAEIDENGMVTVRATKGGGKFGARPYQVREYSTTVSTEMKCTHYNSVKAESPAGIGTDTLVFPKFAPMVSVAGQDGFCVTASLTTDDQGYVGSPDEEAWFCSGELIISTL